MHLVSHFTPLESPTSFVRLIQTLVFPMKSCQSEPAGKVTVETAGAKGRGQRTRDAMTTWVGFPRKRRLLWKLHKSGPN